MFVLPERLWPSAQFCTMKEDCEICKTNWTVPALEIGRRHF
jgi:hypothetical protein